MREPKKHSAGTPIKHIILPTGCGGGGAGGEERRKCGGQDYIRAITGGGVFTLCQLQYRSLRGGGGTPPHHSNTEGATGTQNYAEF
jgi:hypothetical protein